MFLLMGYLCWCLLIVWFFLVSLQLLVPSLSFFSSQATAFPASHRRTGDVSGESFISREHGNSLLNWLSKSWSFRSDGLNHHLVIDLYGLILFHFNDTGAWSLMTIGWISIGFWFRNIWYNRIISKKKVNAGICVVYWWEKWVFFHFRML